MAKYDAFNKKMLGLDETLNGPDAYLGTMEAMIKLAKQHDKTSGNTSYDGLKVGDAGMAAKKVRNQAVLNTKRHYEMTNDEWSVLAKKKPSNKDKGTPLEGLVDYVTPGHSEQEIEDDLKKGRDGKIGRREIVQTASKMSGTYDQVQLDRLLREELGNDVDAYKNALREFQATYKVIAQEELEDELKDKSSADLRQIYHSWIRNVRGRANR